MNMNIRNLKIHESTIVEIEPTDKRCYPYKWQVTRVATGWIYQMADNHNRPASPLDTPIFVPLSLTTGAFL
jgi:hypothetical protein